MDSLEVRRQREVERHARVLAELAAEAAVVERCPVAPLSVFFAGKGEPWLKYEADNAAGVLPLLAALPPLPGYAVENGSLYVGPERRERGTLRWDAAGLVGVTFEHIARAGRSVEVEWWSPVGEYPAARVRVKVAKWPWAAQPQCRVSYGSDGEVRVGEHALPDLGEWRRVKWGMGSADCCRFSLYHETAEAARAWLLRVGMGGAA